MPQAHIDGPRLRVDGGPPLDHEHGANGAIESCPWAGCTQPARWSRVDTRRRVPETIRTCWDHRASPLEELPPLPEGNAGPLAAALLDLVADHPEGLPLRDAGAALRVLPSEIARLARTLGLPVVHGRVRQAVAGPTPKQARATAAALHEEMERSRRPPPPAELVDAHVDRVHEPGPPGRPARSVKVKQPPPKEPEPMAATDHAPSQREKNKALVLEAVAACDPARGAKVAELVSRTGLSQQTVRRCLGELRDRVRVVEGEGDPRQNPTRIFPLSSPAPQAPAAPELEGTPAAAEGAGRSGAQPRPELHRCASPACPGLPWRASDHRHPCGPVEVVLGEPQPEAHRTRCSTWDDDDDDDRLDDDDRRLDEDDAGWSRMAPQPNGTAIEVLRRAMEEIESRMLDLAQRWEDLDDAIRVLGGDPSEATWWEPLRVLADLDRDALLDNYGIDVDKPSEAPFDQAVARWWQNYNEIPF